MGEVDANQVLDMNQGSSARLSWRATLVTTLHASRHFTIGAVPAAGAGDHLRSSSFLPSARNSPLGSTKR